MRIHTCSTDRCILHSATQKWNCFLHLWHGVHDHVYVRVNAPCSPAVINHIQQENTTLSQISDNIHVYGEMSKCYDTGCIISACRKRGGADFKICTPELNHLNANLELMGSITVAIITANLRPGVYILAKFIYLKCGSFWGLRTLYMKVVSLLAANSR